MRSSGTRYSGIAEDFLSYESQKHQAVLEVERGASITSEYKGNDI